MLDDLLQSAKQTLVERLTSPLLSSFAVAWCLWNWRFLVILLSDASVTRTFGLVAEVAFPDAYSVASRGVLFPLGSACVYVFLYPFIAQRVYEFTLRRQKETNEIKQRIANETLLSKEESQAILDQLARQDRAHRQEVSGLLSELRDARSKLEAPQQIPPSPQLPDQLPEKKAEQELHLTRSELTVLAALEDSQGKANRNTFTDLLRKYNLTRTQAEFDIQELTDKGLLQPMPGFPQALEFTHEGRRKIVGLTQYERSLIPEDLLKRMQLNVIGADGSGPK